MLDCQLVVSGVEGRLDRLVGHHHVDDGQHVEVLAKRLKTFSCLGIPTCICILQDESRATRCVGHTVAKPIFVNIIV
jgi:hypothetical protein